MNHTARPVPQRASAGLVAAAVALTALVGGIIAVAFRGSWGALRDAALVCHFDRSAADLYPWGVDGLLIITIGAAVMLRHDRGARRYCLGIIGSYTVASWLINYLHGLGMFTPRPGTHAPPAPPWPVVLVIASLVIGSIFLASHLLVYVWRRVFPDAVQPVADSPACQDETDTSRDETGVAKPPVDKYEAARVAYRESLPIEYVTLSQKVLSNRYGISVREAAQVQNEVKATLAAETAAADAPEPSGVPSQNGQGPA